MDDITFFGKADRNKDGRIGSTYPADYSAAHLDTMKESIERKERAISRGDIPPGELEYAKAELTRERHRYDEIISGIPKLTVKQKDVLSKTRKELGSRIRDTMFSYDDMHSGRADANEEARRMKSPCIDLKSDDEVALAKACNVEVHQGKVSRDDASVMFKIISRRIGEDSNVEHLRRKRAFGPQK